MASRPRGQNVLRWLDGMSLEQMNAIEHARQLLVPDAFTFYGRDAQPREDPILIRAPRDRDFDRATIVAISLVAKEMPSKSTTKIENKRQAEDAIGEQRFDWLHTCCLVSACSHDPEISPQLDTKKLPPPYMEPVLLIETYLPPTIRDVWGHMDHLTKLLDPQLVDLDENTIWWAVDKIAQTETASPLAVMPVPTQLDFLIRVCKELRAYRMLSSSGTSGPTSTPG